ncbi:hypothetical protein HPTD01_3000 [Halomonas sp. TD01]|nr:hypothetical protein HPTD01_3000 [Halomonas sp. TD01]
MAAPDVLLRRLPLPAPDQIRVVLPQPQLPRRGSAARDVRRHVSQP